MPHRGFMLIELSVVLVIIGLIVGGVLVGRDLIKAAEMRSQISQMEMLNQAVNAFRVKYDNFLPGDIPPDIASRYGFSNLGTGCDGSRSGWRNGNGLIEGYHGVPVLIQGAGETALFWHDLSSSKLITETFPSGGGSQIQCADNSAFALNLTPGASYMGNQFPTAKMGTNNFIYVYPYNGVNWFGIAAITNTGVGGGINSTPKLQVSQAYTIDKKVDDGIPVSGTVQALYVNGSVTTIQLPNATATSGGTSASCYDTTTNTYSITQNSGNGINCALSFKFQ